MNRTHFNNLWHIKLLPTWVTSCSASSAELDGFSVAGFHAFSEVWSCTACCSDTVITLRVGVWSARPPLWCRRDITALADTADLVNAGPPMTGGGGMYIGSMFTGKFGRKHGGRREASVGCCAHTNVTILTVYSNLLSRRLATLPPDGQDHCNVFIFAGGAACTKSHVFANN